VKGTYGTRELARPLWVLCLALSASGCATGGLLVEDLASPPHHRDVLVYAGTRHHAREIQHNRTRSRMHWASQVESLFDWWHFVDLPLCLVADTILLPYTLPPHTPHALDQPAHRRRDRHSPSRRGILRLHPQPARSGGREVPVRAPPRARGVGRTAAGTRGVHHAGACGAKRGTVPRLPCGRTVSRGSARRRSRLLRARHARSGE
jgi:uncharacterized protein YceK